MSPHISTSSLCVDTVCMHFYTALAQRAASSPEWGAASGMMCEVVFVCCVYLGRPNTTITNVELSKKRYIELERKTLNNVIFLAIAQFRLIMPAEVGSSRYVITKTPCRTYMVRM